MIKLNQILKFMVSFTYELIRSKGSLKLTKD